MLLQARGRVRRRTECSVLSRNGRCWNGGGCFGGRVESGCWFGWTGLVLGLRRIGIYIRCGPFALQLEEYIAAFIVVG